MLGMAKWSKTRLNAWSVRAVLALFALSVGSSASALTVRSKADQRLWKTVFERTAPLTWSWEPTATAARLTFSNRLTRTVASVEAVREAGVRHGSCGHPISDPEREGLVVATLTQLSNDVSVACETAELAYVPGTGTNRAIVVRAGTNFDWRRVRRPRLAAFDARWWNLEGPTGYDLLWTEPPGWHRVERSFEGIGVVDEALLKFGVWGFVLSLR